MSRPLPLNDLSRPHPLDHPTPDRPHRVYVALTNHCDRSCPWCSTCSSPRGSTWLTLEQFDRSLPRAGPFQVQLEGGEPTIHPSFFEFVAIARSHPRCDRVIVCTNGVALPRRFPALPDWIARLGTPLTLKLSINHHLMDHDSGLISLALLLREAMRDLGGERLLVLNVRLRRGQDEDDRRVLEAVERAGLLPNANVIWLQRYGFASEEAGWDPPSPVYDNFTLVNPDGRAFGRDLPSRSEAMGRLF